MSFVPSALGVIRMKKRTVANIFIFDFTVLLSLYKSLCNILNTYLHNNHKAHTDILITTKNSASHGLINREHSQCFGLVLVAEIWHRAEKIIAEATALIAVSYTMSIKYNYII